MNEYKIICKVHDNQKRIIKVGLENNKLYDVETVAKWDIENKYSFYTMEKGKRAKVYGKIHPTTGRYFLTTEPDGIKENNLDFLPDCN
jgi:hypothetical protein